MKEAETVSLREYIDRRFLDNSKAVDAMLQAAEKAVDKAEKNAEKWRENANEWRGAMNDKDKAFALKVEIERIITDVKQLQLWRAELKGMATQEEVAMIQKESITARWIAIISVVITLCIGIAAIYLK